MPAPPQESEPATMSTRPRGSIEAILYRRAQARTDPQSPFPTEEHCSADQHPGEMVADEGRPYPEQVVPEEASEQPGQGNAEAPVANRRPDQRRDSVAGA